MLKIVGKRVELNASASTDERSLKMLKDMTKRKEFLPRRRFVRIIQFNGQKYGENAT